jgi:lysophospholipase
VFINQAFENTLGGFKPNTNLPDPNWGRCLKCAAIDRAVPARSDFCAQCFQQYCYNPTHPPNSTEVPGRQLAFVNPDPDGLDKVEQWLSLNKGTLAGLIIAVVLVIAGIIGFM